MPRPRPLIAGTGAECSVLLKYLHPSKRISEVFPNRTANERLDGLVAIKKDGRKVNKKMQQCIIFRHDRFPNEELHCVTRFCKVLKEGAVEDYFEVQVPVAAVEPQDDPAQVPDALEVQQDARMASSNEETNLERLRGTAEDISMVLDMGFDVDDDNMPAPENVPEGDDDTTDDLFEGQSWGWDGFCDRKRNNFANNKPFIQNISSIVLDNATYTMMFLLFFPKVLTRIVLQHTNENLRKKNHEEMTLGELLTFIGIQLFMSTLTGFKKRDFWSSAPITIEHGAPYRFNWFMSLYRYEAILESLAFTGRRAPEFVDRFWEVREMIEVWNKNMEDVFSPGWITCLDESMSIWFNRYTCPGWVYCPRKPHPFGNEYHDICCGISGILFRILIVEGKDKPSNDVGGREFDQFGSTTALLLECCKTIFYTGRVVILDSGFCVLKALTKLREYGVYASAVMKKRRYWPTLVKGDLIEETMNDEEIGTCKAISGKLDGVKYNIFCMKDSKFIMKIMTTYGTLNVENGQAETSRRLSDGNSKKFKYTECFANHYKYRHGVDDHNNLRHKVPSIEDSWRTKRWAVRVFSFILAISEVNAFLAYRYFIWNKNLQPELTLIEFRRKLALQLIRNEHRKRDLVEKGLLDEQQRKSKRNHGQIAHTLLTAPDHASFFSNDRWTCHAQTKYPQYVCRAPGCKRRIRTYCQCNPGHWLCDRCFIDHFESALFSTFVSN